MLLVFRRRFVQTAFGLWATAHAYAANPCGACHRAEVAGYEKTAMAHSLSHKVQQPAGTFTHAASGSTFSVKSASGTTQIALSRDGVSIVYPVEYVIGSGTRASGDIVRVGNYLFQSPISYYATRRQWDMAPGYESALEPDFTRPISAECLLCHAGRPRPVANTLNRFEPLKAADEAISCDRCHGDTASHLRHPSRDNIVNPARLTARARDSVCEQCHLTGEARVLNPGKQFVDFHPGQNLEDVFSVYVRDRSGESAGDGSIKVISHVEQLALSKCALKSEHKLWCATCHNPHQKPTNPTRYFRERCLSCHGQAILQTHAKPVDDCVSCHMPKRKAKDGAHSVFTDHFIARAPAADAVNPSPEAPVDKLVAWHEPAGALAQRNMGLANVDLGERQQSQALLELGAQQLAAAMKLFPPDPAILTKLGMVLLRMGEAADAMETLEYAVRLEPERAGSHVNLATAYKEAGLIEKAIAEVERAIELDPSLDSAYKTLGEIYTQKNDTEGILRTLKRYLNFMPNNMSVLKKLRESEPLKGK